MDFIRFAAQAALGAGVASVVAHGAAHVLGMLDQRKIRANRHISSYKGGIHPIVPYRSKPYAGGRVRGLFIGINYRGMQGELRGCVNDVSTMLKTLDRIGFPLQEACILVDDPSFPGCGGAPTRENIIQHFHWLVRDLRPGDTLFLHYSGHGSQVRDTDGDEDDGMDETMVPLDFETAGCIVDDDIFDLLVRPLPAGVRLTAVMDCCHSGSLLDLPYSFTARGSTQGGQLMTMSRNGRKKMTNGNVCMFSGCADSQTSADVSNTASFGNVSATAGGACTNALAAILTGTMGLTYLQLLQEMRKVLRQKKYTQIPELSSSKPIDLYKTFSLFGAFQVTQSYNQYTPPSSIVRPSPYSTQAYYSQAPAVAQANYSQAPAVAQANYSQAPAVPPNYYAPPTAAHGQHAPPPNPPRPASYPHPSSPPPSQYPNSYHDYTAAL